MPAILFLGTFLALAFRPGATFDLQDLKTSSFFTFMASFDKSYCSYDQFSDAFENFKATDEVIQKLNKCHNTHLAGHNKFSDWSKQKYRTVLGLIGEPKIPVAPPSSPKSDNITLPPGLLGASTATVPSTWDWRSKGAVTPV